MLKMTVSTSHDHKVLAEAIEKYVRGIASSADLEKAVVAARSGDVLTRNISEAVDLFIDDFRVHKNEGDFRLGQIRESMFLRWSRLLKASPTPTISWKDEQLGVFRQLLSVLRPDSHDCLSNVYWPFRNVEDWNGIADATVEDEIGQIKRDRDSFGDTAH